MKKTYNENCFAFRRKSNGAAMCDALKRLDCAGCAWFKDKSEFSVRCDKEYKKKGGECNER